MNDNVRPIRPARTAASATDLADALSDSVALTKRLADELERLGNGIVALRDEWSNSDSTVQRDAARRLNALLTGREGDR